MMRNLFGFGRFYERWEYRRGLYGTPDPAVTLPFTYVADLLRWGALGRYIWWSRRVTGWTSGPEAVRLAQAAFEMPSHAVLVELGTFVGRSAVLLAGARKLRGNGRVYCVDPFDGSGDAFSVPIYRAIQKAARASLRARFEENLRRAGVREWVEVMEARAEHAGQEWDTAIDMLFLDGHQSYDAVKATYDLWTPFLKPGGLLVIHNSRPGYRQDTHDGSARLAEEQLRPPLYDSVEHVKSLTLARRLPCMVGAADVLPR
jgi:predicted O-methyltransferase YrrM